MINKEAFQLDEQTWVSNKTGLVFLNHEVTVIVDTVVDSEDAVREIFNEQMELLQIVFQHWDALSVQIEKEILNYQNISKEALTKIATSPTIWLNMDYDTKLPEQNNRWSFVLGVTENEDFGFHTDFEGLTHMDTWAGD